jgi:hypothetical protein
MAWIELFLSYARDGLPQPIDLEFLLPDSGPQRQAIMAEVDAVAQYHYRLKVAHEEKIRRRFEKGNPAGDLDIVTGIEESDEAEILGTVMSELHIDDTAVDIIDDDESSESDDDDEEEEENDSDHDSVKGHNSLLAPVPDRFGPNAERDRRDSTSSGRSGFHRIRRSIDFSRPSSSSEKEKEGTPKGNESPRRSPRPKMSKKKRKRLQAEAEIAPETKAIEEMRPLFMEIVSAY